jgi:hypothetical protein
MSDSYREVTTVSWFGRLRRSVGGVLIGLLLIVGMVAGLFWNEGRAVTTARSLEEGAGVVQPVAADTVDPTREGQLVHVSGTVAAEVAPQDAAFGVTAPGVRLERTVEMYQWIEKRSSETRTKLGGGEETVTTYTYEKAWEDSPVDSSDFRKPQGHSNPGMDYRSQSFQIPEAALGAFRLEEPVLSRIGGAERLALDTARAEALRAAYAGGRPLHVTGSGAYLGEDPDAPRVGDHRVSWDIVPLSTISVVARQTVDSLSAYQTKAGDRLLMVALGTVPADQMFSEAMTANTILTWVLRAVGLLLLGIGFALIMGPIGIVADVIPFLGSLVRMGTGTIAFVLAIVVGGTTIAVAWFWYRPLLAIGILVAAFAIAFVVGRLGRKDAPAPAAA